jgi:hypothetical protein
MKNEIFLGIGSSVAYYDWMRLHRKPDAPRLRQRSRHQCHGFESGCWSHLPSPVAGGYRLGVIRQDDGFAATVFEALASRLFADFFVFNDRADLGKRVLEEPFVRNDLG